LILVVMYMYYNIGQDICCSVLQYRTGYLL
jgi:hypothetical protein